MTSITINGLTITGETLLVYKLGSGSSGNGNYYDYKAIAEYEPPSAPRAGKKEFTPEELILGKEVPQP